MGREKEHDQNILKHDKNHEKLKDGYSDESGYMAF